MTQILAKPKTLSVNRRELKYMVSLTDRVYLLNALSQILTPDEYGDYNGYTVRSMYFDSMNNEDYMDKILKNDKKKRVRLRIYTSKDTVVKFEIKRKLYERELKETITISKEDALDLIDGDYSVLLNYDSDISEYAYNLLSTQNYRPVSVVEYERRAFTHKHFNTRITLDNNLRCNTFCTDLFSDNINFTNILPWDKTILEVKYDRFLFSQIQDVLNNCDFSEKPPSKYGTCRRLLQSYYY